MDLNDENGFTYSEMCYFQTLSQSNTFNITILPRLQKASSNLIGPNVLSCQTERNEILIAFLKPSEDNLTGIQTCSLYQFKIEDDCVKPSIKSLDFVYIPGSAEIVCLNGFMDYATRELVIGIAFITSQKNETKQFLNIYRGLFSNDSTNVDRITECCVTLELKWLPLQLINTMCYKENELEPVFVMSVVREDLLDCCPASVYHNLCSSAPVTATPEELCTVDALFPEIVSIKGQLTRMDFRVLTSTLCRISAFGTDSGNISFIVVDMKKNTLLHRFTARHNSPITDVRLLTVAVRHEFVHPVFSPSGMRINEYLPEDFSLVVCSAVELSVVYFDVIEHGLKLKNQLILPESADHDCSLCCCLGDLDMDGTTEILVGTFGHDLLVYKGEFSNNESVNQSNSMPVGTEDANKTTNLTSDSDFCNGGKLTGFKLVSSRKFTGPIHALYYTDVTGDGVKELIVLTTNGVHFMQANLTRMLDLLQKRLNLTYN